METVYRDSDASACVCSRGISIAWFHMVLSRSVMSNRTCLFYLAQSLDQQWMPPWSWHPSPEHDGGHV